MGIDIVTVALDAGTRAEVIDGVLNRLHAFYVFPTVAAQMDEAVQRHRDAGRYDAISTAVDLCETLTAHLQEVSHDQHLRVFYSPEPRSIRADPNPTPEERAHFWRSGAVRNFGVEKVERLAGNIGYLELRLFVPPDLDGAGATTIAAMTVLAHASALIIDLRRNDGGSSAMVALVSSYLFERRTHLTDLYWREGERTEQFWTHPYVPGRRDAHKPVYILTSADTFSGGEEFAYNLQALKRATLIGETTAGAAHPVSPQMITAHVGVRVPTGRAINPITGTNWEGTGVNGHVNLPGAWSH